MNLALAPHPRPGPALQMTPEMHRIELYALRGDLPRRDRKIKCKRRESQKQLLGQ
jgi:hypothetical protein